MKTIITTSPFGHTNKAPLDYLIEYGVNFELNRVGTKYSKEEHIQVLKDEQPDVIIAGTEKYTAEILDLVPNLKMISRVGIGLDSVDLDECRKRGIVVTYTPNAPSNAVAELTVCQILNMLRKVENVSGDMKQYTWNRYIGRELKNCKVGIIGYGRIGKLLYKKLSAFGCSLYVNDIDHQAIAELPQFWCNKSKEWMLKNCDVISIHIPLKDDKFDNHDYINLTDLDMMKDNVRLLNLSRGGIINERDLYTWLQERPKATVAIDTFDKEPYREQLANMGNAYLTPHLGSCTVQSRRDMELGAAIEAVNFITSQPYNHRVV